MLLLLVSFILFSTPAIASFNQISNHTNRESDETLRLSDSANHINQEKNTILYKNQSFSINPEEITFQETTDKISVHLENATLFNQPGLPLVPMKTITISLPKNVTIQQIELSNYSLQKSTQKITFQQTPMPHFWSTNETPLEQHADEIIAKSITEANQNQFYPESTHSYTIGKNSTHTKAIIHLFPIQFEFDTKETYIINKGTLSISYLKEQEEIPLTTDSVENIIITHPTFSIQAKKLQQFHNDQGIQTEVVTTKWIKSNFEPSEYPPVIGYKDFSLKDKIRKYDDELARKIITYLQSQSTNPQLKYVTILGNAIHVPPSYYFGYNYYPVPTDFYYSSPDLDLIPNYKIGRLPAHTLLEATNTVNKIINWNPTDTQMDNVAIAGGIPFNSAFYIGELITIDSVNRGLFDGLNLDKFYRTDERFENTDITNALQNDYGLLYMICHGNANVIVAEEGRISARNLKNMPKNDNAPIFSCIACSSGSYDTHLIRQGFSMDKTSFGEGMVVSKGGGIAYIGGSRTNNGYPIFTLNNGRVEITKETYMAGLLTYVNQAYKNNANHLGDLTFFAYETYLENNDLTDYWNQYHYLDFILLGDPALRIPERTFEQESFQQPVTSALDPVGYLPYGSIYDDYNGTINLHATDEETTYESQTDSPFINLKQIETGNYQNVEVDVSTHSTNNQKAILEIIPDGGEMHLLRFETVDGKEDWLYYETALPVDDDYNQGTTGFGTTRFNKIQDAIEQSDPHDTILVFEGTYNESLVIDKSLSLQGENNTNTIIDGDGNDDVILIKSDGVIIKDFTIQHCGKNPLNAGISIQPKRNRDSLPILIENNNIINNKNCGIYIDTNIQFMSPTISLLQNNILFNNFGIYIQQGHSQKEFALNTISGNNYGFYVVNSKHDVITANTIENNYVGLHLKDEKKGEIRLNNFIGNTQHCQFTDTSRTKFSENYWDNWIGLRFDRHLPILKIINGYHDANQNMLSQLKIDIHPVKEPFIS